MKARTFSYVTSECQTVEFVRSSRNEAAVVSGPPVNAISTHHPQQRRPTTRTPMNQMHLRMPIRHGARRMDMQPPKILDVLNRILDRQVGEVLVLERYIDAVSTRSSLFE